MHHFLDPAGTAIDSPTVSPEAAAILTAITDDDSAIAQARTILAVAHGRDRRPATDGQGATPTPGTDGATTGTATTASDTTAARPRPTATDDAASTTLDRQRPPAARSPWS